MSAARAALSGGAIAAAAILAVDWERLGGALVRTPADPLRDAWLQTLRALLPADAPWRRAPAHIADDRLIGGLDLGATLSARRPVAVRGLLSEADGGVLVLALAERCSQESAARIAAALDLGEVRMERDGMSAALPARFMLIALDEGAAAEEAAPALLGDRLAFHLASLAGEPSASSLTRESVMAARARLADSVFDDGAAREMCAAAAQLGVDSTRAMIYALRAAQVWAALHDRTQVIEEDLALAARLVLAPRARSLAEAPADAAPQPQDAESPSAESTSGESTADRLVEAVRVALPGDFLARHAQAEAARRAQARARGAGGMARSARRGAPLASRPGALRSGDRLDLIATLRAAAPWQHVRRSERGAHALVQVRRDDFRIRRFKQRLESSIIFVVDASGSTAAQRLGEAKGAVEHLLAEAYITRARAALVAFRDRSAEVLLPPTRSLAHAKRRLADLPGGGATPLAAAIDAAARLALSERAAQRTPLIVLLTDGRGNVARDGEPGRARAEADALEAAIAVCAAGLNAVLIDTSPQARPQAAELAARMGAAYAPLPFADSGRVAAIVRAHAPKR